MEALIKLSILPYLSRTHTIPGAFLFQQIVERLTKTHREIERRKNRATTGTGRDC
jgi:hypothetical protein